MQKVIRRTQLAVAHANRRRLRIKEIITKERSVLDRFHKAQTLTAQQETLQRSRRERKEDWDLGPLAPRRDVGNFKDTYGTLPGNQTEGLELSREEKVKCLVAWGGSKANVRIGDRVVALAGRDKGKIGKIISIDSKKLEAKVEDLNKIDVAIPPWMLKGLTEEQQKITVQTVEKPISLRDLRLVTAIQNPETGETRDVIVKELANLNERRKVSEGRIRKIGGTDIIIPWPARLEGEELQAKLKEKIGMERYTTTFEAVEEVSYNDIPLLSPPMPASVIDELRNKYSVFRTRHTDAFIAEKEKEDRLKEKEKERVKLMRTPLQIKNRKERKARKKLGKGFLTKDMLGAIGQVMAKNKGIVIEPEAKKSPAYKKTPGSSALDEKKELPASDEPQTL